MGISQHGYNSFTDIVRTYITVLNFAAKNTSIKQGLNIKNDKKKLKKF